MHMAQSNLQQESAFLDRSRRLQMRIDQPEAVLESNVSVHGYVPTNRADTPRIPPMSIQHQHVKASSTTSTTMPVQRRSMCRCLTRSLRPLRRLNIHYNRPQGIFTEPCSSWHTHGRHSVDLAFVLSHAHLRGSILWNAQLVELILEGVHLRATLSDVEDNKNLLS